MMEQPELRRLALALIGPGAPDPRLASLEPRQWTALNAMLASQRLQPLLHAERGHNAAGCGLPANIAASWAEAHRQSGIAALRQRGSLLRAVDVLATGGVAAVALKGAWLGWHAYPAPAMRPMRDLDLLVAPADLASAWRLLRATGHDAPLGEPDWARALRAKHLPPLVCKDGVTIELHGRPWESDAQAGHAMPRGADRLLERAMPHANGGRLHYLPSDDTLAHLIIHAVYTHWLDCGPLVMVDIDFLLRRHPPCWPDFWQRARAEGWDRGAALVLGLADRWRRPGILATNDCPWAVPQILLEEAPELLMQTPEGRAQAHIMARIGRSGIGGLARAKWAEARAHPNYFARQLGRRISQFLAGAVNTQSREKARAMNRLGQWLLPR